MNERLKDIRRAVAPALAGARLASTSWPELPATEEMKGMSPADYVRPEMLKYAEMLERGPDALTLIEEHEALYQRESDRAANEYDSLNRNHAHEVQSRIYMCALVFGVKARILRAMRLEYVLTGRAPGADAMERQILAAWPHIAEGARGRALDYAALNREFWSRRKSGESRSSIIDDFERRGYPEKTVERHLSRSP